MKTGYFVFLNFLLLTICYLAETKKSQNEIEPDLFLFHNSQEGIFYNKKGVRHPSCELSWAICNCDLHTRDNDLELGCWNAGRHNTLVIKEQYGNKEMSVYFGRECGDEDFKTLVITNYGSEKNQITKIEKIDNCFQIINIETTKPALQKQFNKDDLDNSNLKTKPNQNGNKHQKHNDLSEIDTEDPSLAVYNITEKAYLTIENSTLTFPVVFAAETITYSVESSTQSINLFCLIEAEYIYMYGRINSTNSPIEIYTNITSNPFEVYFENTKFLGSGYLPVTILVVFEFILIIIFLYLFYKISLIRTGITHLLKSFTQVTEKTPLNKTENDLPSFSSSSLPSSSPKNSELSNSNLSNTDNQISEEDSSLLD